MPAAATRSARCVRATSATSERGRQLNPYNEQTTLESSRHI